MPEEPVEIPLRLRRQEEFGLLHEDDDAGEPGLTPRLEAGDQSSSRGGGCAMRGRCVPIDGVAEEFRDGMWDQRATRRGDEGAVPEAGGEEEGGRSR